MAKEIKYNTEARELAQGGRRRAGRRSEGHPRPERPQRRYSTRSSVRRTVTKDGVTVAKEVELRRARSPTWAPRWSRKWPRRPADDAGDGTTTATVLAQAIVGVGVKNVTAGANPMDLKRGIDKAVAAVVENLRKQSQEVGGDINKIEQVGTHLGQQRQRDRQADRRGDEQSQQGRRHHRRGG